MGYFSPMNVIGIFLFLMVCMFYQRTDSLKVSAAFGRYERRLYGFFALLFAAMYLCGSYPELIYDLDNALFQAGILAVCFIGLYFLFFSGLLILTHYAGYISVSCHSGREEILSRLPIAAFILCVLCRIPFLLYSYPGIMTPDSINQFEQVLGMQSFSNHHPWLHTMTISLFYHIGTMFASTTGGAFVFYTVFQICFLAFAVAYMIHILAKYLKSVPLLVGILCFYALMPYHNVMAICIWKDVMFGGTALIFSASLFDLQKQQGEKIGFGTKCAETDFRGQRLSLILYIISGFLMCLYRTNGWYAFLISFPFLMVVFRKKKKIMYSVHFLLLLAVLLVKGPVMRHYCVSQPDFAEAISIPLQQIGRVIATGQPLTNEEEAMIAQVIDISHVTELYRENISDNMKELVRAGDPEYLTEHKVDYLKLWLTLGLKYPKVYFDAYVQQTKGFFAPTVIYEVAEADGVVPNETGLFREYIIGGKLFVKVREILLKLQNIVPIYGAFWSMASLFWGILIFLCITLGASHGGRARDAVSVESKRKGVFVQLEVAAPWIPNIAVIGTLLLATPVATEFRYAYNLACCIPLYLGIMLHYRTVAGNNLRVS
ncbi:MAG: hypothetical protein IJC59_07770 [Lachnospiraceae bacterium]|nr:hypothetical protein [Lachnospiraceae bacterium]